MTSLITEVTPLFYNFFQKLKLFIFNINLILQLIQIYYFYYSKKKKKKKGITTSPLKSIGLYFRLIFPISELQGVRSDDLQCPGDVPFVGCGAKSAPCLSCKKTTKKNNACVFRQKNNSQDHKRDKYKAKDKSDSKKNQ